MGFSFKSFQQFHRPCLRSLKPRPTSIFHGYYGAFRSFSSSQHNEKTLGVVGAGQMGTGIAIVAARTKAVEKVYLVDSLPESIKKATTFVEKWIDKEQSKNRLSDEEKKDMQSRLIITQDLNHSITSEFDFVIEAVPEKLDIKTNVFEQLIKNGLKKDAVLASNTSSISITQLAARASGHPAKNFIGMHFMNPVPVMTLVEVIKGIATSNETHQRTLKLCENMKKSPATSEDRPGFIANRILMPYINEATFCLQEKISTREDIDKIMKLGTNVPMGPLTLADFIGLDTCLSIMRVLHQELGDSKYRPAPLLINYVEAGWLGKKTGRGFYEY